MSDEHSEYIVFVDESGDHSLDSISADYPLFVLSFCVIRKDVYANILTPQVRQLKFATFGHDMVVLHEHDINKKKGAFSKLGKEQRESFMTALTDIISNTDFSLIAVVIDKHALKAKYSRPEHPYHLAMEFGLERIQTHLSTQGQADRQTFLVCEARGTKEDAALELEFRRICDGSNYRSKKMLFDIIIADKKTNCEGLQLADLMARPIGLSVLRPNQENRAIAALESKWVRSVSGKKEGCGLKVFP